MFKFYVYNLDNIGDRKNTYKYLYKIYCPNFAIVFTESVGLKWCHLLLMAGELPLIVFYICIVFYFLLIFSSVSFISLNIVSLLYELYLIISISDAHLCLLSAVSVGSGLHEYPISFLYFVTSACVLQLPLKMYIFWGPKWRHILQDLHLLLSSACICDELKVLLTQHKLDILGNL